MLSTYVETAPSLQYDWYKAFLGAQEQLFTPQCNRPSSPKFRIPLQYVSYCRTIFRLKEPIDVSLCFEDGAWICENELLGSFSSADTPEHAVDGFCEDFAVLWHEIAQAPDESLAPDALKLKGALLSLVRSVEKAE